MVRKVAQHIRTRMRNFGRRAQNARVKSIGKHRAMSPHHRIERPRDANFESLHASRERPTRLRLDDKVQMIALN